MNDLYENKLIDVSNLYKTYSPSNIEDVIPTVNKIVEDPKSITKIISKAINMKMFSSFNSLDNSNLIIGNDYLVYDKVIYFSNPLSFEASRIINNIHLYFKDELLFSDFGIICEEQIKLIKKNYTNEYYSNNFFNLIDFEIEFQEIIDYAIRNSAKKIKILPRENKIKVYFLIDGRFVEYRKSLDYIKSTDSFFKKIKEKFEDSVKINWSHNLDEYQLKINSISIKSAAKNYPGFDSIVINLFNLNREPPLVSSLNLLNKEMIDLKKALTSPSGIFWVSSREILGSKSIIYSILEYIKSEKPDTSIICFEKFSDKNIKKVSQIEMSDQSLLQIINSHFKENLDFNVIAIEEIKNKEELDFLVEESSKGKIVIAGMYSTSSLETLMKLMTMDNIKKSFIKEFKGVLSVDSISKTCSACALEELFIDNKYFQQYSSLDNSPSPKKVLKKVNKLGCNQCFNGYLGSVEISEILLNEKAVTENLMKNSDINKIRTEKRSNSWICMQEAGIKLVSEGVISLDSLVETIGIYKK
jgi:type II secretory ATPase GspE/PulE/Tfp pilus assembly ATPase PilB-like protein